MWDQNTGCMFAAVRKLIVFNRIAPQISICNQDWPRHEEQHVFLPSIQSILPAWKPQTLRMSYCIEVLTSTLKPIKASHTKKCWNMILKNHLDPPRITFAKPKSLSAFNWKTDSKGMRSVGSWAEASCSQRLCWIWNPNLTLCGLCTQCCKIHRTVPCQCSNGVLGYIRYVLDWIYMAIWPKTMWLNMIKH